MTVCLGDHRSVVKTRIGSGGYAIAVVLAGWDGFNW
jgi:hypothetical protein